MPTLVKSLYTGSDTGSIFCLTYPFSLPIPGFPSASFRFYAVFPMGIFHSPFVIFSIDILLETQLFKSIFVSRSSDSWLPQCILRVLCSAANRDFSNKISVLHSV